MREPRLSIRDLSVERGGRTVLAGFSLSVREGEISALVGPNGAGKSSALLALLGLIPAAGRVRLDGEEVAPGGRRLLERTGLVFQSPALDPRLPCRTNLELAAGLYGLPPKARRARAAEMLGIARLSDRAESPVKELSGGMRRRLEIARALLHEPSLLLLDEPTTGLDRVSFDRTWEMLRDLAGRGAAVLLTTHRDDEAERCDRVAFLAEGRIVAEGSPDELRARVAGDVLVLDPESPEAAREALSSTLGLSGEIHDGRLRIVAERGHELVPRIVEALPRGSLRSLSFHRPGISDAYLAWTGRGLGEES